MPYFTYSCKKCGKTFQDLVAVSLRHNTVCECGALADRDEEAEIATIGTRKKWVSENPRWSTSMGVPARQVAEFRKRFPNSTYRDDGRLLVKNDKDKLRQGDERGMVELKYMSNDPVR